MEIYTLNYNLVESDQFLRELSGRQESETPGH